MSTPPPPPPPPRHDSDQHSSSTVATLNDISSDDVHGRGNLLKQIRKGRKLKKSPSRYGEEIQSERIRSGSMFVHPGSESDAGSIASPRVQSEPAPAPFPLTSRKPRPSLVPEMAQRIQSLPEPPKIVAEDPPPQPAQHQHQHQQYQGQDNHDIPPQSQQSPLVPQGGPSSSEVDNPYDDNPAIRTRRVHLILIYVCVLIFGVIILNVVGPLLIAADAGYEEVHDGYVMIFTANLILLVMFIPMLYLLCLQRPLARYVNRQHARMIEKQRDAAVRAGEMQELEPKYKRTHRLNEAEFRILTLVCLGESIVCFFLQTLESFFNVAVVVTGLSTVGLVDSLEENLEDTAMSGLTLNLPRAFDDMFGWFNFMSGLEEAFEHCAGFLAVLQIPFLAMLWGSFLLMYRFNVVYFVFRECQSRLKLVLREAIVIRCFADAATLLYWMILQSIILIFYEQVVDFFEFDDVIHCSEADDAIHDVAKATGVAMCIWMGVTNVFVVGGGKRHFFYMVAGGCLCFDFRLVQQFIRALKRILRVTIGYWTTDMLFSWKIKRNAQELDIHYYDKKNQMDGAITLCAKERALLWLAFPGGALVQKVMEYSNQSVLLTSPAAREHLGYPLKNWSRMVRAFKAYLELLLVLVTAFNPNPTTAICIVFLNMVDVLRNLFHNLRRLRDLHYENDRIKLAPHPDQLRRAQEITGMQQQYEAGNGNRDSTSSRVTFSEDVSTHHIPTHSEVLNMSPSPTDPPAVQHHQSWGGGSSPHQAYHETSTPGSHSSLPPAAPPPLSSQLRSSAPHRPF